MGGEDKSTRITLKFNSYDFRHNKVVAILRSRPRNMTELVVNAVLHYVSCPEVGQEMSKEDVRKIVREVLTEMAADGNLLGMSIPMGGNRGAVSAEDASDIGSMMSAFR